MKISNFILDFLFPTRCMFCNSVTPHGKGEYICGECMEKVEFCKDRNCCRVCGKPQVSMGEEEICYSCMSKTFRSYKRAISVVKYDSLTSRGIRRFKDGYGEIVGTVMAREMAKRVRTELGDYKFDLIVSAPPNTKRNMKRSFDPVSVICKALSRYLETPYMRGALVKIKDTPKQSGLDYEHRIKNLIGSIGISEKTDVNRKRVLLVDDVMTTGSTVEECSYVLKRSGATNVYAVTFATTVKEPKTYKNE